MDSEDTLKELFRTATQHPAAAASQSELTQKKSTSASSTPNPLLESILTFQKMGGSIPSSERKGSPSFEISQGGEATELIEASIDTESPESVSCETVNISQVKHPSNQSTYGSIISVTGRAIAYVLNGKKIRFIAQENASMGLMDAHDPARLPIVDLAWYGQSETSSTGDLNVPTSNLLASLTKGAEVRVGAVFSDSNTSLAYEGVFASIFPELAPARGLSWGCLQGNPLLAVFGEDPDIFLVLLQSTGPKVVYVSTGIADIRAVYLDSARETLLVAGLSGVEIYNISNLDDISLSSSNCLPEEAESVFLVTLSQGPATVTLSSGKRLLVKKLCGERSEPIFSFTLPTQLSSPTFVQADSVTDVICVGCNTSEKIYFLRADDSTGAVASGTWPNKGNVISVCSSGQLHSVYKSLGKTDSANTDFFLYVYNQDSVKMHHFEIGWNKIRREGSGATHPAYKPKAVRSSSERALFQTSGDLSPKPSGTKSIVPPSQATSHRSGTENLEDAPIPKFLERKFDKLAVSLASDLDKSCQKAVRDACQRMKARPAETAASLQFELLPSLSKIIEDSVKATFERQWLKNVQDTITATIARLSDQISQAIIDASQANHRMVMRELASTNEKLQMLSAIVENLPSSDQIRELSRPVAQIESKESAEAQAKVRVESLIQSGNVQEALVQVLEEGSLPLLNWGLEVLDVSLIVRDLPVKVALSLIQQIGHELSSCTESKLHWLSEILAEFDPRAPAEDLSMARTMDSVFEEVFSNLRILFAQTPSSSPLHKQTKLVMRLLRGVMTS